MAEQSTSVHMYAFSVQGYMQENEGREPVESLYITAFNDREAVRHYRLLHPEVSPDVTVTYLGMCHTVLPYKVALTLADTIRRKLDTHEVIVESLGSITVTDPNNSRVNTATV